MVSIEKENIYHLRDYFYNKVNESAHFDPFKSCFFNLLEGGKSCITDFTFADLSLYQRCAIAGLGILDETVSIQDVSRLLGQAPKIDSTPRPWVSDMFGVMAVKWLTTNMQDENIDHEFQKWISGFLTQQIESNHLSIFEKDIAEYVNNNESATFSSACIPLFLHYRKLLKINSHQNRLSLIERFMIEFQAKATENPSVTLLCVMLYVFNQINQEIAIAPPSGWTLDDLLRFLEHIPAGLKRWTWEDSGRTRGAEPVQWQVDNEYHVQNLLYILLAPIFNDIADEVNLQPVGQKNPRIDLYLPSLHTIIEVKYRKDTKKSFPTLIGEIAEDASLYRVDESYKDSYIISFLWDCTRSTQEHTKFKEGVLKINGIDGCVVINAPSTMNF